MIYTITDNEGKKVVPFGSGAIEVKNGFWTFNGKEVRKCDSVLKQFIARFIVSCKFAYPIENPLVEREASHSVIATQETFYKHIHLKQHNHRFLKKERAALLEPIEILPDFVKKEEAEEVAQVATYLPEVEFIKKQD